MGTITGSFGLSKATKLSFDTNINDRPVHVDVDLRNLNGKWSVTVHFSGDCIKKGGFALVIAEISKQFTWQFGLLDTQSPRHGYKIVDMSEHMADGIDGRELLLKKGEICFFTLKRNGDDLLVSLENGIKADLNVVA